VWSVAASTTRVVVEWVMGVLLCRVATSLVLIGSLVSCKKAEDKPATGDPAVPSAVPPSGTPPTATEPDKAAAEPSDSGNQQYAKADLSEDKIQRYIKSLGEGKNMFTPSGSFSLDETKAWMAEQEAFAKKYGFKDGPDYMTTIGRIDFGLLLLQLADQTAARRAGLVKSIADAEASLAAPNTTAEAKAELGETVTDAKKQISEMDAEAKSFNADDLALIKKLHTEIEAAEAANHAAQEANKPKK
jgi:hypothetical protein